MAASTSGASTKASWSELRPDVLELIVKRLDVASHINFSFVCSNWRSVADGVPPANKHLALAVTDKPVRFIRCFAEDDQCKILGAFEGWLALFQPNGIVIKNKTLEEAITIPLPSYFRSSALKVVFSSSPSSGDCVLAFLFGFVSLACYSFRDEAWTRSERFFSDNYFSNNMIFCMGKLYLVGEEEAVKIVDPGVMSVDSVQVNFPIVDRCWYYVRPPHLVALRDKLLLVRIRARGRSFNEDEEARASWLVMQVFELDDQGRRWVEWESLGDLVLFLDSCRSIAVDANDHPEFRRNCIYWSHYHIIRIFSMEKKKVVQPNINESSLVFPFILEGP